MNNNRDIDGVLVKEFQLGNKLALAKLVKRWHRAFCEKAFWIVKDADVAKDIAQDTWNIIIKKIKNLQNPESFGSWGLRIVYTKSLDWVKKNKRFHNTFDDKRQSENIYEIENDNNEAIKVKLLQAIKNLPEHQYTVINLFYLQEYSMKEIGVMLNISLGTVKSRLFHAREKLKQILK